MKNLFYFAMLLSALNSNSQCFTKVDAANFSTHGIKSDHTLWAWGSNYLGEFGNGTTVGSLNPVQIGTATDWATIAVGTESCLALKNDGTLWAWGNNNSGQLGDGTTTRKLSPQRIGTDTDWQKISLKGGSCFAIKTNGTLWAWGQNNISSLGLGFYSTFETVPTQVGTDTNWKEIISGYDHTLAIKTDNTLWGTGANLYGQMGNGVFLGNNFTFVQIGTENNWKTASTGHMSSFALKNDGSLWAWGRNINGELGDGTVVNKNIPVQIGNQTDWKLLVADFTLTYAIKNDSTLWAWGDNSNYEYGNGTTISSTTPIQISNDTNWVDIATGGFHKVGVKNDNSLYLWGVTAFVVQPTLPNYPSATQFIAPCSLSVDDFDSQSIQIFPNPANEVVQIVNRSNETIVSVAIFDLTGKLILRQSATQEVNVSSLKTGVYLVDIETSSSRKKYKLIKT